MVVAVNTRFLISGQLEGFGYFTKEVFQLLAKQNPQHQFHFFFDRPYSTEFIFADNVTGHVVSPPARHPLLWKYWFDIKLPRLLRKIKADVLFSPDGQCSLRTRIPQCLVVHDLAFLHYPASYKKTHLLYYKKYTPAFIKKAATVITVSQFSKTDMVAQYAVDPQKINVVYNAARAVFKPLGWSEKDAVQAGLTNGAAYFIYAGALQPRKNLVNLLKAFSIFKRRLHSGTKLVLAGRLAWKNDEFLQLLKTYKYRDDVIVTGYLPDEQLAKLVASAYALVYPSHYEGFGLPVIEAMQCHVPVLTSQASAMEEISQGAALYFDSNNVNDIAEKLMQLYKDETGRTALIEKAKQVAQQYCWQKTADACWQNIIASHKKNQLG